MAARTPELTHWSIALVLLFATPCAAGQTDLVKDADAYFQRGLAFFEQRQSDEAIDEFNKALAIDPTSAKTYIGRGLAYLSKGQVEQAIADHSKGIELNPSVPAVRSPVWVHAYNYRGNDYLDKGQYDQAIADFNKALELNPRYAAAYHNRGLAYVQKGENDRGIADLDKALDIDPRYAKAYYHRGLPIRKKANTTKLSLTIARRWRLTRSMVRLTPIGQGHTSEWGNLTKRSLIPAKPLS